MNAAVSMPLPAANPAVADPAVALPDAGRPSFRSSPGNPPDGEAERALFETLWRAALAVSAAVPAAVVWPAAASADGAGAGPDAAELQPSVPSAWRREPPVAGTDGPGRSGLVSERVPAQEAGAGRPLAGFREAGVEGSPSVVPLGSSDREGSAAGAPAGSAAARRAAPLIGTPTASGAAPWLPAVPGLATGQAVEGGTPLPVSGPALHAAGSGGGTAPGKVIRQSEAGRSGPGRAGDSKLSFAARLKTTADLVSRGTPARAAAGESSGGAATGAGERLEAARPEAGLSEPATSRAGQAKPTAPERGIPDARPALRKVRRPNAALGSPAPAGHRTEAPRGGGTALAQQSSQKAAEAAETATAEPAPARAGSAEPVRRLDLQLGQPGEVRLQVLERGGEIHVAVRSSRPRLAAALRDDLGALAQKVHLEGFRMEAWTPPEAGRRDGGHWGGSAGGRHGDGAGGEASSGNGGQDGRQQRREPPAWFEELDGGASGALIEREDVYEWFPYSAR